MENLDENQTGFKGWWNGTLATNGRRFFRIIAVLIICGLIYGAAQFAPGLNLFKSKEGIAMDLDNTVINNSTKSEKLELPEENISSKVKSKPQTNIWSYTWGANVGMDVANGGPHTTEGSLMEKNNVNVFLKREDSYDGLVAAMISATAEFDSKGVINSQMSCHGISVMGDGAPGIISVVNASLDEKFGKDKYHWVVKGGYGGSLGEDKLIGERKYVANPKSLIGSVILTAVGDGDWVTSLNFIFANKGIPVNPNAGTYDPKAVNFIHNPDIIACANDFIASQLNGKTWTLPVVENGKKTGKTVDHKADLVATWLPGDKIVFDKLPNMVTVSSTKDFPNQMITTLIVLKEWSDKNPDVVTNILAATYTACNQIKLYDEWARRGSECVTKVYNFGTPDYWYDMFKGKQQANSDNIAGGSRVMNYADALQYYGLGDDGINRYKAVYDQVSNYIREFKPNGFDGEIVPYDKAVDLTNLNNVRMVKGVEAGKVKEIDYSREATEKIASGDWSIQFDSGSDKLVNQDKVLNELYNLLSQSEGAKLTLTGHTDNTGNYNLNKTLSKQRANSVKEYLLNKGIPYSAFQNISGSGSDEPIGDNNSAEGRYKNRRVNVTILR